MLQAIAMLACVVTLAVFWRGHDHGTAAELECTRTTAPIEKEF